MDPLEMTVCWACPLPPPPMFRFPPGWLAPDATRYEEGSREEHRASSIVAGLAQFMGPLLSAGSHQFLSPKIKCYCYSKDKRAHIQSVYIRSATTGPSLFRPSYSHLVCQLTKCWTVQRKRYTSCTDDILRRYTSYKYIPRWNDEVRSRAKAALMPRPSAAAQTCVSACTLMSTTCQRQTRSDSQRKWDGS